MSTLRSESLFAKALHLMPGGVSSPARAFQGVGGTPFLFERGEGAHIFDVDGKKYTDYVLSWGPLILGHAYPAVIEAILSAARNGTSFGATCPLEIELAQKIVETIPSIEQVRFVSSGTEATMSAMRLARGYTGREKIVKFEGGFHGHSDMLLSKAGSSIVTLNVPDSAGVPKATVQNTLTAVYNDLESVAQLFAAHPGEIAGIIIEPIAGNMGFIKPLDGFLQGLRKLCDENGTLLIFDEVITGFRVSLNGAQAVFGVTPDLTCLGKVIGAGLPVGAYGGRRDIMACVSPLGPVYQSGTLSGNPVSMAAGLAMLKSLSQPGVFDSISRATTRFVDGVRKAAEEHNVNVQLDCCGTVFGIYFLREPGRIHNFETAKKMNDTARYAKFFHEMANRGHYFAPSAFEAGFLSIAHTDEVIDGTIEAVNEVFSNWRE
jgi:glutamate-1-semialdehyde 2,1-aminomutase